MALLTILTEAAIVLVFVAGRASLRQPQERSAPVANLDAHPLRGCYPVRGVALLALQGGMFAFKLVASLTMIETGPSWRPLHQWKILAIMLGVAFSAFLAGCGIEPIGGMQTPVCVQARRDFGMALEAFQSGLSAELMAGSAVSRALKSFMGSGEWTRRNLCLSR
jgi:hypothetical protein